MERFKEEVYLLQDYKEYKAGTYCLLFKSVTKPLIKEKKAVYPPKEIELLVLDNFSFDNVQYYKNEIITLDRKLANTLISSNHCLSSSPEIINEYLTLEEIQAHQLNRYYYIAELKGGHVGNNSCYVFKYPIKATNIHDASVMAIGVPRVKKHSNSDLISIKRVSYEEYIEQEQLNEKDQYFKTDDTTCQSQVRKWRHIHSDKIQNYSLSKQITMNESIEGTDLERKLNHGIEFLKDKYKLVLTVVKKAKIESDEKVNSIFALFEQMAKEYIFSISEMRTHKYENRLYYNVRYEPVISAM